MEYTAGTISFVEQGNSAKYCIVCYWGDCYCIVCYWGDCVSFFHVPTLFPTSQIPEDCDIDEFVESFFQTFELEKLMPLVLCKSYFISVTCGALDFTMPSSKKEQVRILKKMTNLN
jgi:hypothetical protein